MSRRSGSPAGWRAGIVGMESARPCGLLILLVGSSPHFTPASAPIHLRTSTSGQESFWDLDRQPWHIAFDRHRDSFHRNPLNGSNLTMTFAGHGLVGQNVR
jgi:hypothetical protein